MQSVYVIAFINSLSLFLLNRKLLMILTTFSFMLTSNTLENFIIKEKYNLSNDAKIIKEQTMYQSILAIEDKKNIKVYLNNNLQFESGSSESFYHFHLIHPFMSLFRLENVLILGGGDGLPARELLKYPVKINMVDLDREWVEFTKSNAIMRKTSNDSLNSPRVNMAFNDAFSYVMKTKKKYDFAVVDFPESDNLAGLRVHSLEFSKNIHKILTSKGIMVIQNDSYAYPGTEQIIYNTLEKAGFFVLSGSRFRSSKNNEVVTQFIAFKQKKDLKHFLGKYEVYIKNEKYPPLSYRQLDTTDIVNTKFNPVLLKKRLEYFIWN